MIVIGYCINGDKFQSRLVSCESSASTRRLSGICSNLKLNINYGKHFQKLNNFKWKKKSGKINLIQFIEFNLKIWKTSSNVTKLWFSNVQNRKQNYNLMNIYSINRYYSHINKLKLNCHWEYKQFLRSTTIKFK